MTRHRIEKFLFISFRWFFRGKNLIFFTFWTDFLSFSLVFPRETLFSLHFGQISCHFLRFLGFEARLVRLKRSGGVGGGGGGAAPPLANTSWALKHALHGLKKAEGLGGGRSPPHLQTQ